jgi:hypothetical protein
MPGELYPICRNCRIAMRLASIQDVSDAKEAPHFVAVYACPECGRMTAHELPGQHTSDENVA